MKYLIIILSTIITYIFVLPIAIPDQINLTNSEDIMSFIFVMVLFTALLTKLLKHLFLSSKDKV